jgi:hypothetical protein
MSYRWIRANIRSVISGRQSAAAVSPKASGAHLRAEAKVLRQRWEAASPGRPALIAALVWLVTLALHKVAQNFDRSCGCAI